MASGTFFNFTDKQAVAYYEVISCIVFIKLKPDAVSIDKYRICLSTLLERLERDVRVWGKEFLQWIV